MKFVESGCENKEVIMLLHGGGLSWWNYKTQAELLKANYHVILPVLDGHAESDRPFVSIEENARDIIKFIEEKHGGEIFMLGGLSLGGQVVAEILSQRRSVCRYALIESASVVPSKLTHKLIAPVFGMSYGLIKRKWFAKLQFASLRIRKDLFEDYYADTCKIKKKDMIAFLKANTSYRMKESLRNTSAKVLIVAGSREQKKMLRSAQMLHEAVDGSRLEILKGYYHGELSLHHAKEYIEKFNL